jgi:hypothetical protein
MSVGQCQLIMKILFRTRNYYAYEGTDGTDKSLYSSDSVHMVDPFEV